MIKEGDTISCWWTGDKKDGTESSILGIYPYTGRYHEYFNCVLLLAAPATRKGVLEMSYYDPDYEAPDD